MLQGTFWFNGRCSDEFDLKIGYTKNNNAFNFGINRETNIETLPHYYNTYELGSSHEPLRKSFAIYSTKPLTTKKRIEICDWLFVDNFCELFSQYQPDIIYYCKLEGDTEKWIGSGALGYIECEMICNAPFAWSRSRVATVYFDKTRYNGKTPYISSIDIRNDSNYKSWGDFIIKIHIPSQKILNDIGINSQSNLSVNIWNKTNTKRDNAFEVSSALNPEVPLYYDETLQIDMNDQSVSTDISVGVGDVYRHRIYNTNRKFVKLNKGMNNLEIEGICDYKVIMQYPILH